MFLAAESPAAVGEVFNVTDGEPISKKRFVGRVAELAGLAVPNRYLPLPVARLLASTVEGTAKLLRSKKPPLINKARYKFLGLNLDYSIEKARRVLGYHPPYTFDDGMERAMAAFRPVDDREPAEAAAT
jgi:nucleoside-diphosphate-sugar epimerase